MTLRKDNPEKLTKLGNQGTNYQFNEPNVGILEVFPNQFPERDYVTEFITDEFTSLCPKTGQPDFATIKIEYIPDELCIETKSLKLYMVSYRNHGSFMETITNNILNHLVEACFPRYMKVTANFNARGGTLINVIAEYKK